VVRDNGLSRKRIIASKESVESFQARKMKDYNQLTPADFVREYGAFRNGGIDRTIVRTGRSLDETLNRIADSNPEVIGIPLIASANYLPATELGRAIKEKFPEKRVIYGGQHISAMPDEFVFENPWVDNVITGDGIDIIEDVVHGKLKGKIIHGGFKNLENFPLLDPKIIESAGYPLNPTYTYPTDGRKSADFMFSKGCFRRCDFCVAGSQKGNHVTPSEYSRIDRQLQLFKEQGIQELVVQDDAFLHDPKHRREHLPKILSLMKRHGMYWQNNGGVEFEGMDEFVTEQLIEYNRHGKGRVTSLYIPFNPRTWNKNGSASKTMSQRYHANLENLRRLREEGGIYVFTSAIIGTPEQTEEAFEDELKTDRELIQKGYIDSALCLSATMLPGTRWYETNGHNIIDKRDYAGYSLFTTHHKTPNLEPSKIEEMMIRWLKGLDDVQKTYPWQTAFPNTVNQ
jgi:radical SAM superfamily enzyme YgiQ (UPF0313 family)